MLKIARLSLFIFICFVVTPMCQAADSQVPPESKKNFHLNNLSDDVIKLYSKRTGLMMPYITCLAAAQNSPFLCQYLSGDEAKKCQNVIENLHLFYRAILLQGSATPDLIQTCRKMIKKMPDKKTPNAVITPLTSEECRDFIQNIVTKTPSPGCAQSAYCRSLAARDASACAGGVVDCSDNVAYMKAIENNDMSACNNIRSEAIRMVCKAGLAQSEEVCKECSSFNRFFDTYMGDQKKRGDSFLPPQKEYGN